MLCPRIKENDGAETEIKSVEKEFERLSRIVFPDCTIGMIHGQMPVKGGSASGGHPSKAEVMKAFAEGEIDVLVATSVIEVGINIPNATIMIVEGAERFGLAQLYQFRGRVGRGEHQSFCLLFTDSTSGATARRLKALINAKNGFELAEEDLRLRGPGQFMGQGQSGLPDISMDALTDARLVHLARSEAERVLEADAKLVHHPTLKALLGDFEKRVHFE